MTSSSTSRTERPALDGEARLLEVGHIVRPHGTRGEMVVQLVSTLEQRLAPGSSLQCLGKVLVVEAARKLPGRPRPGGTCWVVRFAHIGTTEQAEGLRGATLRAEPLGAAESEGLWVHQVIGSDVVDGTGRRLGRVVSVEANPASDLLVLDSAALVPLRFVVQARPGRLTVDAPPGLFDP